MDETIYKMNERIKQLMIQADYPAQYLLDKENGIE